MIKLMAMHYRELIPINALQPYVKCIWFLRGSDPADREGNCVFPDGSAEIILHRAAPMIARGLDMEPRVQPAALIVGQISRCLFLQPTGEFDVVGIRFTPNGCFGLLGIPAAELTGRWIELSEFCPSFSRDLVGAALGPGPCLARLERVLFGALQTRSVGRGVVSMAIQSIIASSGTASVGQLCRRLNISGRQLERYFDREVGLGPKLFSRIVRFATVVRNAPSTHATSGARLAQQFGYADQAHLVREFREFSNTSPAAYFRADHTLSRLFTGGESVGFVQD